MSSLIFRYELDPDDGYISKIISGVFRSTKNRTNQQKKVPQRQPIPNHFHNKHHVSKYTAPLTVYQLSTNSHKLEKVPIDELSSSQGSRQHLTEITQIQATTLAQSQYHQTSVKNRPYDALAEDYTDSAYNTVPQNIVKENPIITYTQNTIGQNILSSTDNPLISHSTETNSIRNSNNTLVTGFLQKLQDTNQQSQSQLPSTSDNVDVDYSIISLFKILNDFKRAKEALGSTPDHQYYVQSDDKGASKDANTYDEQHQKGSLIIMIRYEYMNTRPDIIFRFLFF